MKKITLAAALFFIPLASFAATIECDTDTVVKPMVQTIENNAQVQTDVKEVIALFNQTGYQCTLFNQYGLDAATVVEQIFAATSQAHDNCTISDDNWQNNVAIPLDQYFFANYTTQFENYIQNCPPSKLANLFSKK